MEVCFARRFGKGSPYMNDPERVREALLWLRYASEDLDVASELLGGRRTRHVCFLAQQAVEKALKAALVLENIDVPYVHDLNALRNRLPDSWPVRRDHPDLSELTVWAAESRYPGDWSEATWVDAKRAVSEARSVYGSIAAEFERRGSPAK